MVLSVVDPPCRFGHTIIYNRWFKRWSKHGWPRSIFRSKAWLSRPTKVRAQQLWLIHQSWRSRTQRSGARNRTNKKQLNQLKSKRGFVLPLNIDFPLLRSFKAIDCYIYELVPKPTSETERIHRVLQFRTTHLLTGWQHIFNPIMHHHSTSMHSTPTTISEFECQMWQATPTQQCIVIHSWFCCHA